MTASWNRPGFQASFDVSMCMSNSSLAKVQYKIDKERVRHENEVKMLNKLARAEYKLTQREVEEVKKELHALRAYKEVAKQTAFKKFDHVELRKKEREQKKRENMIAKGNDSPIADDVDDEKAEGHNRSSPSGEVFVTLRDIIDNDDVLQKHSVEIVQQRRKSLVGNVMEDEVDDVEGVISGTSRVTRWLNSTSKGKPSNKRVQAVVKNDKVVRPARNALSDIVQQTCGEKQRGTKIRSFGNLVNNIIPEETQADYETYEITNDSDVEFGNDNRNANNRKHGVFGKTSNNVFVTENESDDDEVEKQDIHYSTKAFKSNKSTLRNCIEQEHRQHPMTLFQISKLYDQKKTETLEANENKLMNRQRQKAQKEYHEFKMKLQQKERQRAFNERTPLGMSHILNNVNQEKADGTRDNDQLSEVVSQNAPVYDSSMTYREDRERIIKTDQPIKKETNDKANDMSENKLDCSEPIDKRPTAPLSSFWRKATTASNSACQENICDEGILSRSPSTAPTTTIPKVPATGLTRFRNAATAVSSWQKLTKADRSDRMKSLATAIMIKKNTTKAGIPASFLSTGAFTSRSSVRDDDSSIQLSTLEASHRDPDNVKIRPLKMPKGVKVEQEKKWGDLMVNVQYAVYWKAKALREGTGTLNSRQMRRLVRENPAPRRSLFPGQCKTTWSMKKYVKQEVGDVLRSWKPENLRKKRNQKLIEKSTLPQFIDRVRTTTMIMRNFRRFKTHKACDEEEEEKEEEQDDEQNDENQNDEDE